MARLITNEQATNGQTSDGFDLDMVRAVVTNLLEQGGHTLDDIAMVLKMSPRTLQRRLADCGLTYSQLVDEIRYMLARRLIINQTKMVIIASELGYADAGSFTRAFERWTGMTPQHYRKSFTNGSKTIP